MATKPVRNKHAIKRLDAEEKETRRKIKENQEYYQKGAEWHMARVRTGVKRSGP